MLFSSHREDAVPAGQLIVSCEQVASNTQVSAVHERFSSTPHLEALTIVQEGKPIGLVTRMKLLFTLSQRFGYELHARHPVITVADTSPLVVPEDLPLDAVLERAFARPPQDVYDDIIVTGSDGTYVGLLSVKHLVLQQSKALTRSILLKGMATARAHELEKINRLKSQFLAHVTHELRSPVNAIVGLAELLRKAADTGSIDQVRERLSFLHTSACNLRGVITNILDLSKIEAGKMEVSFQPVDVVPLVGEIAESTRILVGKRPVSVAVTVSSPSIIFMTDPVKVRQIVTNLTSNAAKFTERGNIALEVILTPGALTVKVSDTGIGIKDENIHLLFTAFGQLEDAATKVHEGSGLGLVITKNLVKLLGGSISLSSTYGEGSVFTVSLPVQPPESRKDEA